MNPEQKRKVSQRENKDSSTYRWIQPKDEPYI
jgi:hypothetical protein